MAFAGVVDVAGDVVRVREVGVAPRPQAPLHRVVHHPRRTREADHVQDHAQQTTQQPYARELLPERHGGGMMRVPCCCCVVYSFFSFLFCLFFFFYCRDSWLRLLLVLSLWLTSVSLKSGTEEAGYGYGVPWLYNCILTLQ